MGGWEETGQQNQEEVWPPATLVPLEHQGLNLSHGENTSSQRGALPRRQLLPAS